MPVSSRNRHTLKRRFSKLSLACSSVSALLLTLSCFPAQKGRKKASQWNISNKSSIIWRVFNIRNFLGTGYKTLAYDLQVKYHKNSKFKTLKFENTNFFKFPKLTYFSSVLKVQSLIYRVWPSWCNWCRIRKQGLHINKQLVFLQKMLSKPILGNFKAWREGKERKSL